MHPGISLILALSASATAAKGPDSLVVVAVDDCSQDFALNNARLLRASLAKLPGVAMLSEEDTGSALGGPQRGSLADVDRLLASARLDFQRDLSASNQAEKALSEAMAILMSQPPANPYRWQLITEVASFQAQIYLTMSRTMDAEKALEGILRVDPGFQVDRDRYSPDMWKLTDRVRARVKGSSTATLTLKSIPERLAVSVDGRLVGKTPVSMTVPPGNYRVEGVFGNDRRMARSVHVERATTVELDQSFDGTISLNSGVCVTSVDTRDNRLASLMKLATYLGVNQAVGIWKEEPVNGEVYLVAAIIDATTGQEVREAKVKTIAGQPPTGAIEKLARFVEKGDAPAPIEPVIVSSRPRMAAGMTATPSISIGESHGSSRKTWGWAFAGVGAASLVTGAIFDAMAHSAYEDQKKASANGDAVRYQSAHSDLMSRRTAAVVMYGTAAVGAGIGAYLLLTGHEPSTSVSVLPSEGGALALVSGRLP